MMHFFLFWIGITVGLSNLVAQTKINNITLYGGASAGGSRYSCAYARARILLRDEYHFDLTMYYRGKQNTFYDANFAKGEAVSIIFGALFGDKYFSAGNDSALNTIRYKNLRTGEYVPFVPGFHVRENMTIASLGLLFSFNGVGTNYWKGHGSCFYFFDVKFDFLYAPTISYNKNFYRYYDGPYETVLDEYVMEGEEIKKWGMRLVIDLRFTTKLSYRQEMGMMPGIAYNINEEGTFRNGYVRFGMAVTLGVGGKKYKEEHGSS